MLRRIALTFAAVVTGIAYTWFAAVRAAPEVRRRKADARDERRRRATR